MTVLVIFAHLTLQNKAFVRENLCERQCAVLSQSSTYSYNSASLASDGVVSTREKYCAITDHGFEKAWLQVDLGRQFSLKSIKIFSRREGEMWYTGWQPYRLRQFYLDVSDLPATRTRRSHSTRCYTDNTTYPDIPPNIIDIPCIQTARYVIVKTTYDAPEENPTTGAILEICEIEVYGCEIGHYGSGCRCCEGCQECDVINGTCATQLKTVESKGSSNQFPLYMYVVSGLLALSVAINVLIIIRNRRGKVKRQTGRTTNRGMDVPSSTNDAVQRPVIYKIVEKDAGYQELGDLSLSGYQDLMNQGMEGPSFTDGGVPRPMIQGKIEEDASYQEFGSMNRSGYQDRII